MARTYVCCVEELTKNVYCWGKGTKEKTSSINLESTTPVKV